MTDKPRPRPDSGKRGIQPATALAETPPRPTVGYMIRSDTVLWSRVYPTEAEAEAACSRLRLQFSEGAMFCVIRTDEASALFEQGRGQRS